MKHAFLFIVMACSLCLAGGQPNEKSPAQPSELRKTHEEKRDQDGKVNAYVDTVFRGNVQVMMTVKMLTQNKYGIQMIRGYFANGENVVDEIHYEDGTQVIRLYKRDVLCEMFRRQGDGSVEPVSSEELAELKAQQQGLMEMIDCDTATQNPLAITTAGAGLFLADLHKQSRLPGDTKDDHGTLTSEFVPLSAKDEYPFLRTFHVVYTNQTYFNNYTVMQRSKDAAWQLQRAWRTSSNGHVIVEWPVK